MPPDLPRTTLNFLIALLKNQAILWLGEDATEIAAQTLIDEDLQKRLDDWLNKDKTTGQLLKAAQQTQIYLQDPQICPDADLRRLFRDLGFGDLPSVQAALAELPASLDSRRLTAALRDAFARDVPNLSPGQREEGAQLYTDALLRAVGQLKDFTQPILIQTVLDIKQDVRAGQADTQKKLDEILQRLRAPRGKPSPTLPGNLPSGSYMPFPRNAFFTGREAELEKLAEVFLGDGQAGVVINQAVTGMGGLGKTQLAVEFAYMHGHKFKGVHWLDLREAATLETQIALCGERMRLPAWPPTLPEQINATIHEWLDDNPRLLILDNFEELQAANDVVGRLHHSGLRLLITSRRTDWTPALGLHRLALDEFSPEESLAFLRKYVSSEREDDEEILRLADHLGHLPLALELSGRYLDKQPRLDVRTYLEQLDKVLHHKSMQNWKAEFKSLTGHDLSLAQTFAQSWEQVKNPVAQKLFMMLGYCSPNTPIPPHLIEAALGEEAEADDECVADLIGLGLLKEGPSIHPLLAQFARGLDADNGVLQDFAKALADLASQTNHAVDRSGDYSLYAPILAHVRQAAEHGAAEGFVAAGSLWHSLGYHISDLADYAGARAAFERALKIDEAAFGADHPNIATDVNNLGLVLKDLGDLAGARAAFERALKIDEAAFGADHPNIAIDVNNLGLVLKDLGDLAGARAAFERALRIFEKFLPPDHPNIRIVRGNLDNL